MVDRVREPFTGDLEAIRERGLLRVLVNLSRTNFYFRDGRAVGFEAELMRRFEQRLNRGVTDPLRRVRVVFVPTPYDRLVDDLVEGRGDVVAATLSVTFERSRRVAFSDPYLPNVEEVLVHHPDVRDIGSLDDLAGRRVVVRADSSYAEHLRALDLAMRDEGGKGLDLVEADPSLGTEDLLELVASGAIDLTFADDYLARAWSERLEGLVIRDDVVLHQGVQIAWAVRPGNPELRQGLDEFARTVRRGSRLGNILFERYLEGSQRVANPMGTESRDALERLRPAFEEHASEYGFDWIAIAAQAYQESKLDHSTVSSAGAVGLMQLRPSTAAGMGFDDISDPEVNIRAGVVYLAHLRDHYFEDVEDRAARLDLSWAAYNAGPTRIQRLRRRAEASGLDPDRWFGHVEQVAAERIGSETVDYVRGIVRYYVAFTLAYEGDSARRESIEILHGRSAEADADSKTAASAASG